MKYVLYKRTGNGEGSVYLIASQLKFGEIVSRAHERLYPYDREVVAESDDLHELYRFKNLAEGVEDEI